MTIPDLNELADRVCVLGGPDREVDRAIMEFLSLKPDYAADWGPRNNCRPAPFAYTASLDAAMSLIEPDEYWRLGNDAEGADPADFKATVTSHDGEADLHFYDAVAATPALALTAAALRARAQVQP